MVTPDGFQGDERDVILYSLSWDNDLMPRQALSQRQRNHSHEQGMLNVALTRARDEIHIFHSAPIEHSLLMWFSVSRCVTVEDKVASFDGLVAGKAGVVHRLVSGFPIVKLSEPPAAGRAVFS